MIKKDERTNATISVSEIENGERSNVQEVAIGSVFNIGRPYGATYDQIYLKLGDRQGSAVKLLALNELIGSTMRVISIIKLVSDETIVGLETLDKRPIYSGKHKVFAYLKQGIASRELIRL